MRGLHDGSWVQLTSRYGKVRVQAVVTDRVKGHELYMPMNSVEQPVNRLTSSHTDKVTSTPAYKETSVRMEVLPESGTNPLPRTNSRFGHPSPQNGVEVERKWKRADYHTPGTGEFKGRNRLLLTSRPAIRARNSSPALMPLPSSTPKRCSRPTNCSRSFTIEGCSKPCAVLSAPATSSSAPQ